jgi:small subunit ribosomal protein S7
MARRRKAIIRVAVPDAQFGDVLISKFIGLLMRKGKRSIAESICYGAFSIISQKHSADPVKVFKTAVDHVKPTVEVKSRRVGGASYQVPIEVAQTRRISLALRWLTLHAKKRPGKSMQEKLAAELFDASNNTGAAVKKKEDVHRMAEANKAFAAYRW